MPPALAAHFTVGELAVLRIVADAVREQGTCVLTIPEIAARAGVGQTKARMAIREAEKHGLLTIEERRVPYKPNLPNVVRIISREWLTWIAKATPRTRQGGGSTFLKATDNKGFRKEGTRTNELFRGKTRQKIGSKERPRAGLPPRTRDAR